MARRKISRDTRRQIAAVEAAGGSVRFSGDGHAVFLAADGSVIGRSRTTGEKSGRASRDVTQSIIAAVGPPPQQPPPKPRPQYQPDPVQQQLQLQLPPQDQADPVCPPERRDTPMEKRIRICDACDADGRFVGAVDSVRIESMVTAKRSTVDLCQEHVDQIFAFGTLTSRRPAAAKHGTAATNGNAGRTLAIEYRCDEHDVEYSGVGMTKHWHGRHDGSGSMPDDVKAAFRAAFDRAHHVAA